MKLNHVLLREDMTRGPKQASQSEEITVNYA